MMCAENIGDDPVFGCRMPAAKEMGADEMTTKVSEDVEKAQLLLAKIG